MKRLLFLLLISCSTILAQSTGNVRNSYYSGGQWNTGTWTGSGVAGVNSSGAPTTLITSVNGGTNIIPVFNATANLVMGTFTNTTAGIFTAGNVVFPHNQGIGWADPSGTVVSYLYNNLYHSGGAEALLSSPRICFYWTDEVQLGSAGTARTGKMAIYLRALNATSGDQLRETPAFDLRVNTYTGGVATPESLVIQGVPLDNSGTNGVWRFITNAVISSTVTATGNTVMDVGNGGVTMYAGKQILVSGTSAIAPAISSTNSPGTGVGIDSGILTIFSNSSTVMQFTSAGPRALAATEVRFGGQGGLDVGADSNASTLTANTNKVASIRFHRYDSASAMWTGIHATGNSGANTLNLGGGTSVNAPATQVSIYSGTSSTVAGNGVETIRSIATAVQTFVPTSVPNLTISGTLTVSGTSAAPSNTLTPASWADVYITGTLYKLPLYQ